jgi:hypothetical protein
MVGLLLSGSANTITNFVYAQQQQEEQEQQQYSFVGKWGSFGTGDGQFENVVGIAINSFNNNNVYTSNSNGNPNPGSNHRIQEFTKQGQFITKWGTAGSDNGQFIDPFGIAFDSSGNVYVADQVNQRIQKFTSDGTFIKSWGISTNPTSIAIDSKDNVYITVQFSHLIAKYTSDGTFIKSWGSQGTDNGQFEYPRGIAIDSNDNVYVSDLIPNTLNYRVQKFTSNGTFITSWGSLGGSQATSNQFNGYGIAIDTSNNVYVADSFGNRIQKFTNNGMLITQFGTAGIDNGQFDTPHDIAVDSSGNVYVADTYNHRIQVFALAGTTTTTPDTAITSAIDGNGVAIQNGGSTVSTSITFQVTATTPGTNPIAGF